MTLPEVYGDDADDGEGEGERGPTGSSEPEVSKRSRGVALVLAFFGGFFGLHRFYVEKPRTAIAMLLTLGGCGVWYLYDLVLIAERAADERRRNTRCRYDTARCRQNPELTSCKQQSISRYSDGLRQHPEAEPLDDADGRQPSFVKEELNDRFCQNDLEDGYRRQR